MSRFYVMLATFSCVALLHADSRPADRHPDMSLLPKAAAQLDDETTLFPRPTKWLRVPWLLDLNDGIRTAKAESRPILIWVNVVLPGKRPAGATPAGSTHSSTRQINERACPS